jgi:hypothetical protein
MAPIGVSKLGGTAHQGRADGAHAVSSGSSGAKAALL